MHGLFKIALTLAITTYVVALIAFASARVGWLEPIWLERATSVMAWMGQPWIHWFELQLNAYGSPIINIFLLGIFTYLSQKRRRNR